MPQPPCKGKLGLLAGRALVVAREPVVRDLLPARRIGDELPVLRADARVAVESAEADADHLGVVRVAAPELRSALRAELLREAAVGLPGADELLAGDEP